MIDHLRFKSGYPVKLRTIGKRQFNFTKGLNIIFGQNGVGKSTLLRALAEAAGCAGGGWSGGRSEKAERSFDIDYKWDGKPVFYQDCYRNSEKSFIDDEYFEKHPVLMSTGEKRIGLINELINYVEDRFLTYKLRIEDRPTLLLDEVDNHIGFGGQAILWNYIFRFLAKKYQVIVSTHSIFALLLKRPEDIISLDREYARICIKELGDAIGVYNKFFT
jgi:predicted ATPase